MANLLYRIGLGAHRRRLLVVLLWLAVLVGSAVGAATLSGQMSGAVSIPGQESTTALERIKEEFGSGGATARVVLRAPDGATLTSPANAKVIGDLVAEMSHLPGVVSASNPLDPAAPGVNADQTTAYSTVTYSAAAGEVTDEERTALTEALGGARTGGLTVEVTGEAMHEVPEVGGSAEVIGVIIALLILALTYGTLVTAGMNLLTAAVGVGIGTLGITIASGFMDLQSTTPTLAAMLGLAVGIDYALFIINRYRQELRHGADVGTAVATAVGTAGGAVVTAGLTVVIALVGLSVVGIPFLTQMGIAAAATIVVAVLIAITLVPAVLSFLGRRVLRRGERNAPAEPRERGFFRGWIGVVTRRPRTALLICVLALGAMAAPAAALQTTLVQTPAPDTTQARAEQLLADGFGPGFNGPLIVLFEGADAIQAANRSATPIGTLDGVALVTPARPDADGTAAMITVIPKSGPTSPDTERLVTDLRTQLSELDGVQASVTGATAVSVDVAVSLDHALPIYLALVVGLALVLLVLVFRSLLVPLVGVLGFLLTIGASLGATVAVFQWGWLGAAVNLDATGPLISLTPILVIGILFGLAMDYQIFLVSRMHEAHHRGAPPHTAIVTGFRQAGPVVVTAALIMLSVFSGFVPAGEATIKSIAFALAVGIFTDAFLVRMIIVPATLTLLRDRAWWLPTWLRWLPTLDIEGTALRTPTPPDPHKVLVGATRQSA
jgi:putative drug exporter of the RND superfamily